MCACRETHIRCILIYTLHSHTPLHSLKYHSPTIKARAQGRGREPRHWKRREKNSEDGKERGEKREKNQCMCKGNGNSRKNKNHWGTGKREGEAGCFREQDVANEQQTKTEQREEGNHRMQAFCVLFPLYSAIIFQTQQPPPLPRWFIYCGAFFCLWNEFWAQSPH